MNEKSNITINMDSLLQAIVDINIFNPKGSLGTVPRLKIYLNDLYQNIDFRNKSILDVGAGYGLFSLSIGLLGAKKITALEPELEGGTTTMVQIFRNLANKFNIKSITILKKIFQEFEPGEEKFDVILFHNSINHLNEENCITLLDSEKSRAIYKDYFANIFNMQNKEGILIITDCSRFSFFDKIGLKSPLAPSIEWHKHQAPEVWISLAESVGYKKIGLTWTTTGYFSSLEKFLFSNKIASYFLMSHFKLYFKK